MKTRLLFSIAMLFATFAKAQEKPLGLALNDIAPNFTAKDQYGKTVNLKALLNKGPVVLLFYRGQWCPYCNKQLNELQDSLTYVTSKGATVVAVTPEQAENISKTIEKTKASYSILFDEGLNIMKNYKVAFQIDAVTIEKYKEYGIDFNEANGTNGANLPIPAVYIINKQGQISYRHFNPDYRKRPSVKEIAKNL